MKKRRRCELKPWSYRTFEEMPRDLTGIYAFWYRETGRCVYIGKASDQPVTNRLRQHWRRSHNETLRLWIVAYGEFLDVCYAAVDRRKINALERRLIRRLNPEANVQHKR